MITIILPLPPTANKLWRPVRTGTAARMIATDSYREWGAIAKREVAQQRSGATIAERFHVCILLPDDGPWDLDNLVKPLLDACQHGGAISNDKLCRRLWVDCDDTRTGTALVELTPIPPIGCAPDRNEGNARKDHTK